MNSPGGVVDLRPALGESGREGGEVVGLDLNQRVEELLSQPPLALRGREVLMPVGPERLGDQEPHFPFGLRTRMNRGRA